MPACIFAVGFFVYVLWEAKAQYTEPFFMFLIPMTACGAERIAALLDRIADSGDRRAGLPSNINRGIQAPYAESPAAGRTATAPGTPSDPLLYSISGQPDGRYDSRGRARTSDTTHADGARVLRKGRLEGGAGRPEYAETGRIARRGTDSHKDG